MLYVSPGKTPVVILKLKMWDKGWLISTAMAFNSLVLSPSISVLVSEIKALIVVTMTAGET